jgi:hypothetical protein
MNPEKSEPAQEQRPSIVPSEITTTLDMPEGAPTPANADPTTHANEDVFSDGVPHGRAPPKYRKSSRPNYQKERGDVQEEIASELTPKNDTTPALKTYSRKDKGNAVSTPPDSGERTAIPKRSRLDTRSATSKTRDTTSRHRERAASESAQSISSASTATSASSQPSPSFTHEVRWTNASPVAPPPNFIGGILRHQHHAHERSSALQTYSRKPPVTTYTSKAKQAQSQAQVEIEAEVQSPVQTEVQTTLNDSVQAAPLGQTQSVPSMSRTPSVQGSPSKKRSVRKASSMDVSSPRTTRSNCRYHKMSIPKTENGPRICFLVPGCSLANREFMQEEEIEDLGLPEPADQERMVNDIESLEISAYLVHVLRIMLGVEMLHEHDIFYVPAPGEVIRRRKERPRENKFFLVNEERPQHLSQRKRKRRQSFSESSLSELDELSDDSHATENSIPTKPDSHLPRVTIKIPPANLLPRPVHDTDNLSPSTAVSPTETASIGTSRASGPTQSVSAASKARRSKRLSMDAAAYAPGDLSPPSEASDTEGHSKSRRRKSKKHSLAKRSQSKVDHNDTMGSGLKRSRTADEADEAEATVKKQKTVDT